MLGLLTTTSHAWLEAVLADFDAFLLDHAANERKASAMAMTFVVRYPDRDAILEPMIQLAREELTHFHRVFKLMQDRGLRFERDQKDLYVGALIRRIQEGRDAAFLDRLLMAGIVEARGCERFGLLAAALKDPELQSFYEELTTSEARHAELFVELAQVYFPHDQVAQRSQYWRQAEAEAIAAVPARAALH